MDNASLSSYNSLLLMYNDVSRALNNSVASAISHVNQMSRRKRFIVGRFHVIINLIMKVITFS